MPGFQFAYQRVIWIVHTVTAIYVQVKNADGFTLDIEEDSGLFYVMDLLSDIHGPLYTYLNQARTPVAFALGCSEVNVLC